MKKFIMQPSNKDRIIKGRWINLKFCKIPAYINPMASPINALVKSFMPISPIK
jgi:hypothetical protein